MNAVTLTFSAQEGWEQLPDGWEHPDTAAVAVDSRDRVFVVHRAAHPVIVYDREGSFVTSWGDGRFKGVHGITIDSDDFVYITDRDGHNIQKFTPDGELLMTLGQPDVHSDTGAEGLDYRDVKRGADPFNRPTNLAIAPNGDLYVSDGYANCRVHVFSRDGALKHSWGEPGVGPGQFHLVHGIAVLGDGRVFVCDRENDRIQIFGPEGEYLGEWGDVQHPSNIIFDGDGRAFVSELPWPAGATTGTGREISEFAPARLSVFSASGELLTRFASGDPKAWGNVAAPHGMAIDSSGDLYVAEVCETGARVGWLTEGCQTLQKFVRS